MNWAQQINGWSWNWRIEQWRVTGVDVGTLAKHLDAPTQAPVPDE
jgi:hypothetical protein